MNNIILHWSQKDQTRVDAERRKKLFKVNASNYNNHKLIYLLICLVVEGVCEKAI